MLNELTQQVTQALPNPQPSLRSFRERISSQYHGRRGVIEVRPAIMGVGKGGNVFGAFIVSDGYAAAHPENYVSVRVDVSSARVIEETPS